MAKEYVAGIDEAGRGPVLGPLVYGLFYVERGDFEEGKLLESFCVKDSKQLSAKRREEIEKAIKEDDKVRQNFILCVANADEISSKMLRKRKVNLNDISKACACDLIRRCQEECVSRGGKLVRVILDTIMRKCEVYQRYLEGIFPDIIFTVEKKADDTYPIVSAASIVAKVERDRIISNIKVDGVIGSGYPADPKTKAFLKSHVNSTFGYHPVKENFVRISWATIQTILSESACQVDWSDDDDEYECEDNEYNEDGDLKKKKKKILNKKSVGKKRTLDFSSKIVKKRRKLDYLNETGLSLIKSKENFFNF